MTLDASGNLGIGTTNPSSFGGKFTVLADGSGTGAANTVIGVSVYESVSANAAGLWFGSMTNQNTGVIGSRTSTGNIAFQTYNAGWGERMRLTYDGNLLVGTTSASGSRLDVRANSTSTTGDFRNANSVGYGLYVAAGSTTSQYVQRWADYNNNTLATIDGVGNLLVGVTSPVGARIDVASASGGAALQVRNDTAAITTVGVWNDATSGDNTFVKFYTEAAGTTRGSITYNRAGGLVAYNVTSDYRAKDIYGPVQNPGALIDSVPVYMGKMKDATQERPMFIAHEVPAYAHTGEKDAVDKDGKPVYQQMDASALIPVMWAELQSLRARVAQLESKP